MALTPMNSGVMLDDMAKEAGGMAKVKTFEEWAGSCNRYSNFEDCWSAARVGMVPEDECIRLPKVEEWPDWAVGVRLVYEQGLAWSTPSKDGVNAVSTTDQKIRAVSGMGYAERPAPAWTPKVGEAVFCGGTMDNRDPRPGKIDYIDGKFFGVKFSYREKGEWDLAHLKPFAHEHIGKPWEEIPNA